MFKKSEIKKVVKEINSNKNKDLLPSIFYDTADDTIWVDFHLRDETIRYKADTIHEIFWAKLVDFDFHILKNFTAEILADYMINKGFEVDKDK